MYSQPIQKNLELFIRSSLILFILLLLTACQDSSSSSTPALLTEFSGHEMTIDYRILVGQNLLENDRETIQHILADTFNEVDQIYNKWNPHSELSKLNSLKAHVKVRLSEKLLTLLNLTNQMFILTEGRFDPTIEPLQTLWKKHLEKGSIPSQEELKSLAKTVGWKKIHIHEGFFYKEVDEIQMDLGGIAKGYCVDLIVERLNKAGYKNVFVEWGGEIRASGIHPEQRPWNIFISRLGDTRPENAIAILSLNNQAIATSGDYLQSWTIQNREGSMDTYSHIIDPVLLKPLMVTPSTIASVSVISTSCARADALATALMLFPNIKEAHAWGEKIKKEIKEDVNFWIVSRDDLLGPKS
ncbi:MAG: FAD:protein FMN transferase [Chlamydiales bacterium]|nr:FAD:protein FMN transferase [Chlamydiales bacterium]